MTEKLDELWFDRLRSVSGHVDESLWLQDHIRIAHEERERFIDNEIENPLFTYRKESEINVVPQKIDELRVEISKSDAHVIVAELYDKKLSNEVIRNALIEASLHANDEEFFTHSVALHGKPRKRFFSYVAMRVKQLCEVYEDQYPNEVKRLLKVVSKIATNDIDIDVSVLPPVNTDGVPVESIDEVIKVFKDTLERLEINEWSLVIDNSSLRTRFSVDPFKKLVLLPNQEQLMSRASKLTNVQLEALAEHEVGVHARRAHEAINSPLKILKIGLDSYLPGEEGLAGYVQQQIEGADEFYGFDRYLAACLAVGVDGTPRDFRAVFSLMTDYYTLKFKEDAVVNKAPFRAAWDVCVRIFRGTTGQTAGCIYTKDIVYMEGNIGIWNLLSEKPHVFESLFVGKFNPLLNRHVRSLQTLEILKEW
ncbi:DUF1704 domain-containing protein [Candidatus Nomurabacteria bacterium]|nr:DUF1704 domain-containing protein [Candidatus Nomurabacteria bacterium]